MAKERTTSYRYLGYGSCYNPRSGEGLNYQLRIGIDTEWISTDNHWDIVHNILKKYLYNNPLVNGYKIFGLLPYARDEELKKSVNTNWLYGTRDNRGCDRDQMGKEVCIYLFDACDIRYLPELKKLLCTLWKALQEQNVPLRTALAPGDRPILMNNIPTIFSYTFERKGEWETRHGILGKDIIKKPDSDIPNHALNHIGFSAQELSEAGIMFTPEKNLAEFKQIHEQSLQIFEDDLKELDAEEDFNIEILIAKLKETGIKQAFQATKSDPAFKKVFDKCPGQMHESAVYQEILLQKASNVEEVKTLIEQEILAIKEDYLNLENIHPTLNRAFQKIQKNLDSLIQKNPKKIQTLYYRLVLLNKQAHSLSKYKNAVFPVQGTLAGIDNYLKHRDKSLNFFSFWFDYDRGKNRANLFAKLLKEYEGNKTVANLLIYTLLASDDGSNLKKEVILSLGFQNRASALKAYKEAIDQENNYSEEQIKQLNKEFIQPMVWATNTNGTLEDIKTIIDRFDSQHTLAL